MVTITPPLFLVSTPDHHSSHFTMSPRRFPGLPRAIKRRLCPPCCPFPLPSWCAIVLVSSIGCIVCWTCNTSPWMLWNRLVCWDVLPRLWSIFLLARFFDRFLCRDWFTFLRLWAYLLLIFFRSHFSSSAAGFCEVFRTFRRSTWRQLHRGSESCNKYLLYGLLLLGYCVFSVISSVFANEFGFFWMWMVVGGAGWSVESEGRVKEGGGEFEFIEVRGRRRCGWQWGSGADHS